MEYNCKYSGDNKLHSLIYNGIEKQLTFGLFYIFKRHCGGRAKEMWKIL